MFRAVGSFVSLQAATFNRMNEQTRPVNHPLAKKCKKRKFFRLLVKFRSKMATKKKFSI